MESRSDDNLTFNAKRPLASSAPELLTAGRIEAQQRVPALVGGYGRTITVIKMPFSGGQNKPGVELGPEAMLADEFGLVASIAELGWGVPSIVQIDCENPSVGPDKFLVPVEKFTHILNPTLVSDVTRRLNAAAKESRRRPNNFTLVLGGDHSLAIGSISGVAEGSSSDICVIWVDAHTDINVPQTSNSGKLHGCPVSFLLGMDMPVGMPGFKWVRPCLTPDRIAYIGVRDLDAEEKKTLKAMEITVFTMKEVVQLGIEHVLTLALAAINPRNELPIHLSFDIDGLDPSEAPSTGTAVRGGLNFREGRRICEKLAETGNLVSMDLAEVNPSIGEGRRDKDKTVEAAVSLIKAALGEVYL